LIRRAPTPAGLVDAVGSAALRWNWAIWASLLVSRPAIEAVGFPRLDLWFAFTDLEYTLRLSARYKCVLAPAAVCAHLQPSGSGPAADEKIYWGLQHGDLVSVRCRHGWRALRHLPGHQLRFLRHYRWRPRAWWDVARAFVGGAVLGRTSTRTTHRLEFERAAAVFPEWKARPAPSSPAGSTRSQ
jgi:GT2 family glycosyltransferase